MNPSPNRHDVPRAHAWSEQALRSFERFLHIEAVSGVVLLIAAALALIWANSSWSHSYHALWHAPLSIGLGGQVYSQSLHFWINDGLMTIFFLVVGMEIRREMHDGSLSQLRQASLPLAAALGGVVVPALIFLALNTEPSSQRGWAVPTATDIAFALGVLALLGRSIPGNVRIFLLALAIIDDVVAVLIIAFFYSGGLDYSGFLVAAMGLLAVVALQQLGVGQAYAYVLPGAVVWAGLLMTGAHPTLAGVVLGLMTPVRPRPLGGPPRAMIVAAAQALASAEHSAGSLREPMRQLQLGQRELLPPVVRVQAALHPWVAYGIMPLFALANAGVSLDGLDLSAGEPGWVMAGVALALVLGKPLGVVGASWLVLRLGWCGLPPGVTWGGILLVGLLAGIGFTMSIFIATLAFSQAELLGAAKLGILLGSLVSAVGGLAWGLRCGRRR